MATDPKKEAGTDPDSSLENRGPYPPENPGPSLPRQTERDAFGHGVGEAFGAPALVLGVGYIGYGSLAQSHGFSMFTTGLSTVSIWALPGQLIMVEMNAVGAPFVAILLAV